MKLDRPIYRGHKRPTDFHFPFVFAIRLMDFVLRSFYMLKMMPQTDTAIEDY